MAKKFSIVFVHGLAKKPAPEKLEEIWLWGLERRNPHPTFGDQNPGIDLNVEGVPYVFNYYADVFYGTDYEDDLSSYYELNNESANETELRPEDVERVAGHLDTPRPKDQREAEFIARFEAKLMAQPTPPNTPAPGPARAKATTPGQLEIASWLPGPVKEAIIKKAAMEAYYYLFNKEYTRPSDGEVFKVRDELRRRLIEQVERARNRAEKVILVTHSMGTMIAYDVLRNCPACPAVDTLITVGSPLGVQEVQDELVAEGRKRPDFPATTLRRWVNIYDPLDPVCGADPNFSRDYEAIEGRSIEDVKESNWGSWRHTITHYLAGVRFRALLAESIGVKLASETAKAT